ncbi:acyltransferase family protein [Jonesia quinghaiensis]|uniref:acyltransferase family protein n=1 Tax=Jonesia quinghaiensis TaxID=262806 RepID=UPI0004102850|nr:acyltransferase family protein [Jonesia quinghaiensis]
MADDTHPPHHLHGTTRTTANPVTERPASGPHSTRPPLRKDIQALRAFAVVAVVVYHVWPWLTPGGFVGVDVFFVISGFLITGHIAKELHSRGRLSFGRFYAKRAKRILPPAYLTIALGTIAALIALPSNRWSETAREGIASIIYLQNVNLADSSMDYLAQDSADTMFMHFWSLSVEEQFYLIVPVLMLVGYLAARKFGFDPQRVLLVSLGVVVGASFVISVLRVHEGDPAAYFVLTTRLWELGVGSLLAIATTKSTKDSAHSMSPALASSPARGVLAASWSRFLPALRVTAWYGGWGALLGSLLLIDGTTPFPGHGAVAPVLATAAIIWAHEPRHTGWLWRVVAHRATQYVGNVSYSMYLVHWPLVVLAPFVFAWAGPGSGFLIVGITLALAGAMYQWVEKPLAAIPMTPTNTARTLWVALAASAMVAALAVTPGVLSARAQEQAAEVEAQIVGRELDTVGGAAISRSRYSAFAVEPEVIVPSVDQARESLPSGAQDGECKSAMGDPFTPECVYGTENADDADAVIALVGDSHAEHYLPAFEELAQEHNLQIRTYFHSSCPLSLAQRVSDADRGGPCLTANEETLTTLEESGDIDLIVTSARTDVPWVEEGSVTPAEGFAQVWARLEPVAPVLVFKDNPSMLPQDQTTDCVALNADDPGVCGRSVDEAMPVDHQLDGVELAHEQGTDVTLVDTQGWFCTDTQCPAVVGNVLVYRDENHVTATYAATLADRVWEAISPGLR